MQEKQIDFVVILALPKELNAFLRHVGEYTTHKTDIIFHRADIRTAQQQQYRLIILGLPEMGNYEAAAATTRAIDVWNPRFVLLGGIAGGTKEEGVRLGDVIVADLFVAYEPAKQLPTGPKRRFRFLRPAGVLVDAAKKMQPQQWALNALVPRPDGQSDRVIPRVHFGVVISGEKVIASSQWMKELSRDLEVNQRADIKAGTTAGITKILGVEMEAYGTALATYRASTAPGMLMAKAICDWADKTKNDGWQEYAADISASFLIGLLQSGPVPFEEKPQQAERIDSKRYSGRSKLGLCRRMDDKWEDLADYYDIPLDERRRFRSGRECQDIWKWLENRKKLGSLPDALKEIGREDLIDELLPEDHVST